MSDVVDPLVLDLLEWIGPVPRPYVLEQRHEAGGEALVAVSARGRAHLDAHRTAPRRPA